MSTLLEQWREGHGLPGVLVIDGHTHIGEWPTGATFDPGEDVAEGAIAMMDAYGVDAACVLSGGYMFSNGSDYRLGNDRLLACVRRFPERLIPFAFINPHDSLHSMMLELERMFGEGVRALKLWNEPTGYPGDGPNLMALYEFAERHDMLVVNHYWSEQELRKIAAAFPGLILICAHGGASRLSSELAGVYDNIWSLWPLGTIERGIQLHGPDKILFGSDAFMNDPSVGIGMVVYADIPDDYKRLILGLNMARLLDRVGALPSSLRRWLTTG
jgi:predicted TIM-barrel fold metal-dependent hydrolase